MLNITYFKKVLFGLVLIFTLGYIINLNVAHAYTTSVNGTNYNFSTFTGTWANYTTNYGNPVWWGSETLALNFADALGGEFGLPNGNEIGPLFVYAAGSNLSFASYQSYAPPAESFDFLKTDGNHTFAVASEVIPEPVPEIDGAMLPQALLLMAALGMIFNRRRTKA